MKKSKKKESIYVKSGVILLLSFGISSCIWFTDNGKTLKQNEKGEILLKRNDYGQGDKKTALYMQVEDIEQTMEIAVGEKEYSGEQLEEIFIQAEEDLETLILGENESLSEVRSDLNLITEIPEKSIEVSWELDNYEIMDIQGSLKEENLKDEGALLGLKALLTYKEESRIYEFYAHVFPPKKTKEEKLENQQCH